MRLVGTTGNGVVNAIDRLIVPGWLRESMGPASRQSGRSLAADEELPATNSLEPSWNSNAISNSSRSNLGPSFGANLANTNLANTNLANGNSLANIIGSNLNNMNSNVNNLNSNSNNLPALNSQPLHFEQPTPGGRPVSAPQASSFSLSAGDRNHTTTSGHNSLDSSFDAGPTSGGPESSPFEPSSTAGALERGRGPGSGAGGPRVVGQQQWPEAVGRGEWSKNMQLIEKLAQMMQARKFASFLLRSRLREALKPDMNYVILVPTDQAVERLPRQIVELLERDSERLNDLVSFHVLDTTFEYINTIPDGQTLNTLNEKDILFNWHRNNTILTASGAVVLGGIQEENIALLIVDRVLYPTPGDLLSIVSKSPILSNFTSLLRAAKLEQQLSLAGPYTLFAPSDFAFNQLAQKDLDFLQRNRETARRFLLRHLCQPAIFTSSIALSNTTETLPARLAASTGQRLAPATPLLQVTNSLGEELTLRQRNDYFSVNEVNFSYADVAATNGVVHVIDGIL